MRPNTASTRYTPDSKSRYICLAAWSLPVLLAFLISVSQASAQEAGLPALPTPDFSIATYNINYGNADLSGVVRTIRKAKADVVALQETNKRSERYLRKLLKKTYPHMVFHHAPAAGGFAMLSKVPLEKSTCRPPLRSAGGWFGTQTAFVTLGGRQLMLVNVHLTATVPSKDANTRAALVLFRKTEAVRDKEIRHIVEHLPKRWPVVVLGDFNSIPGLSSVPGFMTARGFTDCLADVVDDADGLPTWRWKRGRTEFKFRLDYIFSARTNARPVKGKVIRSNASDHFLVTCSYQWLPHAVALGDLSREARSVVYLVDPTAMTPDRVESTRQLVTASIARLKPEQYLCVGVSGPIESFVPAELMPATKENKKIAGDGLPVRPSKPAPLLPDVRKAIGILSGEAAPKALFLLSDRLAKDPHLLKSVRAQNTDKLLQLYLLDAEGKLIPD